MPLHIFEPRYRQLVQDIIDRPEQEQAFGVVAIRQGHEVGADGVKALYEVGCMAQLRGIQPYPDGRFDIVTVGADRFDDSGAAHRRAVSHGRRRIPRRAVGRGSRSGRGPGPASLRAVPRNRPDGGRARRAAGRPRIAGVDRCRRDAARPRGASAPARGRRHHHQAAGRTRTAAPRTRHPGHPALAALPSTWPVCRCRPTRASASCSTADCAPWPPALLRPLRCHALGSPSSSIGMPTIPRAPRMDSRQRLRWAWNRPACSRPSSRRWRTPHRSRSSWWGSFRSTASLDLKALARAVGVKRLAMAPVVAAERSSGYVAGGISPIGQRKPLTTVLDASALDHATVLVSGGQRGFDIELAPDDLVTMTRSSAAAIAT